MRLTRPLALTFISQKRPAHVTCRATLILHRMLTRGTYYTPEEEGLESTSPPVLKIQRASPAATPVVSSQTYQTAQSLAQHVGVIGALILIQWVLDIELLTAASIDLDRVIFITMVTVGAPALLEVGHLPRR